MQQIDEIEQLVLKGYSHIVSRSFEKLLCYCSLFIETLVLFIEKGIYIPFDIYIHNNIFASNTYS